MKDEEYELLPHREILKLRDEVDRLKANPVSSEAANLVTTMNKLNESISRLIHIFEGAEKELAQEYKHSKLDDKLGRVVYQNKEIAKGIIAVADLIKKRQIVQPVQTQVQPVSSPEPQQSSTPPSLEPEPVVEEPSPIPDPMAQGMMSTPNEIPSSVPEHADIVPPPPEKKKGMGWFSK
ncbi:MAG: hypothetical protein AABX70_04760 [Nanoarchaeota archaeon]